jgi:hypothetical protein
MVLKHLWLDYDRTVIDLSIKTASTVFLELRRYSVNNKNCNMY